MPAAYVVGQITVRDPVSWDRYRAAVPGTLEAFGGELLFRGRRAMTMGGDPPPEDIVVIRFASIEQAHGWFASPAYQALVPLREQAADVVLASYLAG